MPIIIAMSVEQKESATFRLFALAKTQEGHPPGLRVLRASAETDAFPLHRQRPRSLSLLRKGGVSRKA